jgi:RHS repeat-associated protein
MKSTGGYFRAIVAAQLLAVCVLSNLPREAAAQAEYAEKIKLYETVQPKGDTPFGENINMFTGELSFLHTDIEMVGKGPPIVLARGYEYSSIETLGGWSLTIPRIEVLVNAPGRYVLGDPGTNWQVDKWLPDGSIVGTTARCTEFNLPFDPEDDLWMWWAGGYEFTTDRGEKQQLLKRMPAFTAKPGLTAPNGTPYAFPIVTQENWQVGCLPSTSNGQAGEGFLAVSPDGTKYYLDYLVGVRAPDVAEIVDSGERPIFHSRMAATMFVSRIVDRFGNTINYNYTGDKLNSIVADDGRSISIAWATDGSHRITAIKSQPGTPNERVWQYGYSSTGRLSSVTLPDLSSWSFSLPNTWKPATLTSSTCSTRTSPSVVGPETIHAVTTPSGLTGTFKLSGTRHGRSYVPSECVLTSSSQYESSFPIFGTASVIQKTITGPGVSQIWNYAYAPVAASTTHDACAQNGTCADTTWMDVSAPNGDRTRHTISTRFGAHEGKTLKIETFGGGTLQRTQSFTYAAHDQGPYPARFGSALDTQDINARVGSWAPLSSAVTTQDGISFSSVVEGFDQFARPTKIAKASTLGHFRKEVTTYNDNQALWVMGQLASVKCVESLAPCTGIGYTMSKTDYDASLALPVRSYGPGEKLFATITYNSDGTVATKKDANNNVTAFSSWKRGIPQSVKYPITPESPTGATQSVVVDDNGLIRSVTDENGYKTCYSYDPMGRVSLITHPSENTVGVCDSSAWAPTTITFTATGNAAAYGMPASHWRQTILTGNGRKILIFDALWRPVVEQTLDLGNVSGTLSEVIKRYDTSGRVEFQSYPMNTNGQANYADTTLKGVWTDYDALNRVTSVSQDSELTSAGNPNGLLTTLTEYLPGFQTRVTNPKGQQTLTTMYQAYDQPTYDWPRGINHPEGAFTEIYRDVFGKPTAIKRRNITSSLAITRGYAYNGYQELCRSVEPETGATLTGYDAAGNLSWSASGLPAATACDATGTSAAVVARKAARTYDARNRVKTLSFPNGVGNQTWTYAPDGLPTRLFTYNTTGGTTVANDYAYNKRRLLTNETLITPDLNWPLTYTYNANGHLSAQIWQGLNIDYAPNALGQPTKAGTYANGVGYYPNGAIKQFTYGNGIVHTMTQNARQLPSRSTDCTLAGACAAANQRLDLGYTYDKNANVSAITDYTTGARQTRGMTYDNLDRLTQTTSGSTVFGTATYGYNVLDNLTTVNVTGGSKVRNHTYVYDANNQLANVKNTVGNDTVIGLEYDFQGNLKNKNGVLYDFDFGNRLRTVTDTPADKTSTYIYDGLGRRVRDTVDGLSKHSHYLQNGQLSMVGDSRTNKVSEYVYLGGSLIAIRDRDVTTNVYTTKYQHTDALGTPIATTGSTGAFIEKSEYEPYGQQVNVVGAPKDGPGYTGHVQDGATGLTYMQQRYYDPTIGRFLSVDPVTANSGTGANFNRYWYANNNPYKFTDPDGRRACGQDTGCQLARGATGGMFRVGPPSVRAGDDMSRTTLTDRPVQGNINSRDRRTSTADGGYDPTGAKRLRSNGARRHQGVDIGAEPGTPVVAAAGGTAQNKSNPGGYGIYIDIDHGEGLTTRYAHLQSSSVENGKLVRGGDEIGKVGRTGNLSPQTKAHLHFEVRRNGELQNPLDWFDYDYE